MMSDCGCRYEPWLGIDYATHEIIGGKIIYCPKHKAAPEMYEALKKLRNPSYDPGRGSGAHRDDFWKAMDMATKAIALADGSDA